MEGNFSSSVLALLSDYLQIAPAFSVLIIYSGGFSHISIYGKDICQALSSFYVRSQIWFVYLNTQTSSVPLV